MRKKNLIWISVILFIIASASSISSSKPISITTDKTYYHGLVDETVYFNLTSGNDINNVDCDMSFTDNKGVKVGGFWQLQDISITENIPNYIYNCTHSIINYPNGTSSDSNVCDKKLANYTTLTTETRQFMPISEDASNVSDIKLKDYLTDTADGTKKNTKDNAIKGHIKTDAADYLGRPYATEGSLFSLDLKKSETKQFMMRFSHIANTEGEFVFECYDGNMSIGYTDPWWNSTWYINVGLSGFNSTNQIGCFNTSGVIPYSMKNSTRIIKDNTTIVAFSWNYSGANVSYADLMTTVLYTNNGFRILGFVFNITSGDFIPSFIEIRESCTNYPPNCTNTSTVVSIHQVLPGNFTDKNPLCYGRADKDLILGGDVITLKVPLTCMHELRNGSKIAILVNLTNGTGDPDAGNPNRLHIMYNSTSITNSDLISNIASHNDSTYEYTDNPGLDIYYNLTGTNNDTEGVCFWGNSASSYNAYFNTGSAQTSPIVYQWKTYTGWNDSIFNINSTSNMSFLTVGATNYKNPYNPKMFVNDTQVWSHTGSFETSETVDGFEDEINTFLQNCNPDIVNTCLVPLNFSSESEGILEVTNISITYDIKDTMPPFVDYVLVTPNPAYSGDNLTLKVNATDNVNVTKVNATLDGQSTDLKYSSISGLWEGSLIAPSAGNYSINITSTDWVGLSTVNITLLIVKSAGIELAIYPQGMNYSPSIPGENDLVTINATIHNLGDTNSGDFDVGFFVNDISVENKTLSVNALSQNTIWFNWSPSYGEYVIAIMADVNNTKEESNETNNYQGMYVQVFDKTPPAINDISTSIAYEDDDFTINADVTDNIEVASVVAEIGGQTVSMEYTPLSEIKPGFEGIADGLPAGTYTLTVTAYDTSGLSASKQKQVTIYDGSPDLIVENKDILIPQPLTEGGDGVIYANIRNLGNAEAGNFTTALLINGTLQSIDVISVDKGAGYDATLLWNPSYGTYNLTISTDYYSNITESDESNNIASIIVNVKDGTPPVIQNISAEPVYAASLFSVSAEVTDNVGISRVAAEINDVLFTLFYNNNTGLYEGNTTAPAAGTYDVYIFANDTSGLNASREQYTDIYGSYADLALTGNDVILPLQIAEGQALYINATIHNLGGAYAPDFIVGLYIDDILKNTSTLSVSALSENDTGLYWQSPTYGNHTLKIKADSSDIINDENNESNNEYEIDIAVPDTTPPPAPNVTAYPADWTGQTTHDISWQAVSDTNGINHYEYKLDYGNWTDNALSLSFTTPSQDDGVHIAYVRAVDGAGNKGEVGSADIYIDTTPPGTPFMREWHCGNNWTSHDSPYFTWTDPGDIGSGVVNYNATIDNNASFYLDNTLSYHGTDWGTGTHTFRIQALDYLNQSSGWSNTITVYIDTTKPLPPNISSPTHPDNTTWYAINTPVFNLSTPSDDSGIEGYYYKISRSEDDTVTENDMWTSGITINITGISSGIVIEGQESGLDEGIWYLHMISKDNAGNIGNESGIYMVKIDANPPLIISLVPANNSAVSGKNILVQAVYSDEYSGINLSSVSLFIDSQNATPSMNSSTAYATKELSNGTHTANLFVQDNVGHASNISWSFSVLSRNLTVWLDKYEYYRPSNELVNIYSNYTYSNGDPIQGASVTAEIRKPNGTMYLNLTEGQPGIYTTDYPITDEDWTGNVTILAAADDDTAMTSYFLSPEWWDDSWHFRVPLTISLNSNRTDAMVESTIDLGKLLDNINYSEVEQNSIRIIDHESGQILNENHDFINDTAADILYRMNGLFYQGQNKTYWIYFDTTDNGEKPIEMTYFEGAWKANEFYLYTNDYADIFCYEDNCSITILNATSWQLLKQKTLSRGGWYAYPETRSINNTIFYINSTKPISVLSRTLNVNVTGTEDEVYSLKGREFFTLVQKNLWITSYNDSNQIIIQDFSDGDDNHTITLNKGEHINYTDIDGDLLYINSTSDMTIVAGYEDDNVITAVFGENNKDYYTPIFGVLYIVGMYNNTIINVTDPEGGQGNWYGILNKSKIKELDFGVNVQIGNGPEFEWGEIHSDKPVLVIIQAAGVNGTDALGQFFVPDIVTSSVGRKYVTFGPRTAASFNYNWSYDVIATEDNTNVVLTGNITDSFTLNRGQRYRYNLSYNETVEIKASKKVSVDSVFQRVEVIDQEGYTAVAGKEFSFEENTLGALDILLKIDLAADRQAYNKGDTIQINETVLSGRGRVCDADITSYVNRSDSTTQQLSLNDEGCYWSSSYAIGASEPQGQWLIHANASKEGYEYYTGEEIYHFSVIAGEEEGRLAIEQAINNTMNASIYTDKQIYIRYINETQSLGRFDKIAAENSQRWAFNYITSGESYTNMTGIGTTVNIWENSSLTSEQIRIQVEGFINNTMD